MTPHIGEAATSVWLFCLKKKQNYKLLGGTTSIAIMDLPIFL